MDPVRDGLNATSAQVKRIAMSAISLNMQIISLVNHGKAIFGGKSLSAASSQALKLDQAMYTALAKAVLGAGRRRLLQTGAALDLTSAAVIRTLLSGASTSAKAAGIIASEPSAADLTAVAQATANVNAALSSLLTSSESGTISQAAFLNTLNSLYSVAYIADTTFLDLTAALAAGSITASAYSASTSATKLVSLKAAADASAQNAAFYCTFIAASLSTSSMDAATLAVYNARCFAPSPPPPPSPGRELDLWFIALIVVVVLGLPLVGWAVIVCVRRRGTELETRGPEPPRADTSTSLVFGLPLHPGTLRKEAKMKADMGERGAEAGAEASDVVDVMVEESVNSARSAHQPSRVYF